MNKKLLSLLLSLLLCLCLCTAAGKIIGYYRSYQADVAAPAFAQLYAHDSLQMAQLQAQSLLQMKISAREYRSPNNDRDLNNALLFKQEARSIDSLFEQAKLNPDAQRLAALEQSIKAMIVRTYSRLEDDYYKKNNPSGQQLAELNLHQDMPHLPLVLHRSQTDFQFFCFQIYSIFESRVGGDFINCYPFEPVIAFHQSAYAIGDTVRFGTILATTDRRIDSLQMKVNGEVQPLKGEHVNLRLNHLKAGKHTLCIESQCWHYDSGTHNDTAYYTVVVPE